MAPLSKFVLLAVLAALGTRVRANYQIPMPIINLSPHEVAIDMTGSEECLDHDFGPDALNSYYAAYAVSDLGATYGSNVAQYNNYLQTFKQNFGVSDLSTKEATFSGTYTLQPWTKGTAPDFLTFGVQGITSWTYTCDTRTRSKDFTITVNGTTGSYSWSDPWNDADWSLTENSPSGQTIDLGKGESIWADVVAAIVAVTDAVIMAALIVATVLSGGATAPLDLAYADMSVSWTEAAYVDTGSISDLGASFGKRDTTSGPAQIYTFTGAYDTIDQSQRNTCVLHEYYDSSDNSDCLAAGFAIVIQANGQPLPVPLPSVGGAGGSSEQEALDAMAGMDKKAKRFVA